jgi:hypothetical protein
MSQGRSTRRNKGPRRPTTARAPQYGIVISLLFHVALALAVLVTLGRTFDVPQESHAVPVDLVTIANQTNIAAQSPPKPKPEKIDIPTPAIEPPELPQFQEAEPAPDIAAPKFKIVPDKKPTPREQQQDFAALLNKLTAPTKAPPKNAKAGPRTIAGIGAGTLMTADLADALKSRIYRCWSPPIGAPNADDLVVDFDLQLNPDGTVASLRLSPGSAMAAAGNSYTRAASEAARRAVYQCQPYQLPANRYGEWREVNPLHFDPRDLMGQ